MARVKHVIRCLFAMILDTLNMCMSSLEHSVLLLALQIRNDNWITPFVILCVDEWDIRGIYSIALVGTPWRVGDKADELSSFHMAPPNQPVQPVPTPISNSATSKPTTAKKRKK